MAELRVAGTDYKVGTASLRYRELAVRSRVFTGKIVTDRPGAAAVGRVWTVTTDILSEAEAETLCADLVAPGTVTATGDVIGSSVTCKSANVVEEIGQLESHRRVSFELHEVTP